MRASPGSAGPRAVGARAAWPQSTKKSIRRNSHEHVTYDSSFPIGPQGETDEETDPAPGTALVNPLGLVRSGNGGSTWDRVGFEGEADFHLIATGYDTPAVYVYTAEPNGRMKTPGIWATLNDGFAWRRVEANGFVGKVSALAAHSTDVRRLAAATSGGLFLSQDGGDRFERVAAGGQALAVQFSLDGKSLWFASHDGRARLYCVDLGTQARTEIVLPPLTNDAVAYIAQNPATRSTYAIATFERDIHVTANAGRSWRPIAERGRTK